MESFMDNLIPLTAIVFSLGLPIVVMVFYYISTMHKKTKDKEIRQLIIENKTDLETAKLLIDEPKKQKRELGPVNIETLRWACILLGIGLGAFINWFLKGVGLEVDKIYFWLIIAFGIGIGLLCSFLIEMRLYKKYGNQKPNEEPAAEPSNPAPEQ